MHTQCTHAHEHNMHVHTHSHRHAQWAHKPNLHIEGHIPTVYKFSIGPVKKKHEFII